MDYKGFAEYFGINSSDFFFIRLVQIDKHEKLKQSDNTNYRTILTFNVYTGYL
jgi:hypothetical protein